MKIVIDSAIPYIKGVFEPWAEVEYLPGGSIGSADVRTADALVVRTRTRCNSALLGGSRVRFVGTATIGFDHVDVDWCREHGVAVATAAGCNKRAVLQWVSAVLAQTVDDPRGVTLGVVGVGNVGSLVAEYAQDWGFDVMRCDPPRERAEGLTERFFPLELIARQADIVTFHVPLDCSTRHLVGPDWESNALIINSSRGGVAAPGALNGRRFVLDTWNGEPAIDRAELAESVLATPHIAGYSAEGKAMATAMIVRQLAKKFDLPFAADWYPENAPKSNPRRISWDEMRSLMPRYFDIVKQSKALKINTERFEQMRDDYAFRTEFF